MTQTDVELRKTLECWLNEVNRILSSRIADLVTLVSMPRWHASHGGALNLLPYAIYYNNAVLDEAIFSQNNSWKAVEQAAQKHPNIQKHLGKRLYCGNFSQSFELKQLCMSMLSLPELHDQNTVYVDTDFEVEQRVAEFVHAISLDYFEQDIVWPIWGLETAEPLVLDEFTTVRRMSIKEKISALNSEIVKPHTSETQLSAEQSDWYCICRTVQDHKYADEVQALSGPSLLNRSAELDQVIEDFLTSVPLVVDQTVLHAGGNSDFAPRFETGRIFNFGVTSSSTRGGINGHHFFFPVGNAILACEDAITLDAVWKLIRQNGDSPFHKRSMNAARRLYYAQTRSKLYDTIVDLMIAAESLYLDVEQNELSYRLSLNAALWAGRSSKDRRKVFAAFKKAYYLRSKVVHGGVAKLDEIATSIETIRPILKAGVKRAFDQLRSSNASPIWEEMMFPVDVEEESDANTAQ